MASTVIAGCDICGKDMYDSEKAYATTAGRISSKIGGFNPDTDEPWFTVACEDCGERISAAMERISAAIMIL